jgi:hypothetical protein
MVGGMEDGAVACFIGVPSLSYSSRSGIDNGTRGQVLLWRVGASVVRLLPLPSVSLGQLLQGTIRPSLDCQPVPRENQSFSRQEGPLIVSTSAWWSKRSRMAPSCPYPGRE